MGLRETPRRLIRKCYRYSSLERFEDVFEMALQFIQKTEAFQTNDNVGIVWATPQLVDALVLQTLAYSKVRLIVSGSKASGES